MRYVYYLLFVLMVFSSCKSTPEEVKLKWISIEEADKIAEGNNNKKFLVDVYTDWCGWCKVMDEKTFTDPELIRYLNEHYYVVKFNAEQKESVTYKGKQYQWQNVDRNGVNMLGYELLNGKLSYPSLVYLNSNLEPIKISPGYKDPVKLLLELQSL